MYYILLIQSSVNGHLGCLCFLVTVNDAAMNMDVQISLLNHAFNFGGYTHKSGVLDHMLALVLIF